MFSEQYTVKSQIKHRVHKVLVRLTLICVWVSVCFTDFICYNGISALWYHRRQDTINPNLFVWEIAGNVNTSVYVTSDRKKLIFQFNALDPSIFLNQYLPTVFNTHVVTTDTASILKIDTIGKGPDITNNSVNTLRVNKFTGVTGPVNKFYPNDPADDYIIFDTLSKNYPYKNLDIVMFQVYSGQ